MSLKKGSSDIGSVYKGSLPIAAIYKGNDLIWQNVINDITFKLVEDGSNETSNESLNHITYLDKIADFAPITYDNAVCDIGNWDDWVNGHFTPVMLKSDGTVDYELNRENQNYKADGVTASDISNINYDGNAMLQIKKFYISCSTETVGSGGSAHNEHTIKISDTKKDSSYTCNAFIDDNGVEQDYIYYSLFNCHKDSNDKLRSIAGITLDSSMGGNHLMSYSNVVTYAKNNGNGWNISNLAIENLIGIVLMMLYKSVNPMLVHQSAAGYYNNNQSNDLYGQPLSVSQTTGGRASVGGFPYNTYQQQVKALWIEDYWRCHDSSGQCKIWVNGLASLKKGSGTDNNANVAAYYKTTPPFDDFTQISEWTEMSNSVMHIYASDNFVHFAKDVTFYDNIMFTKSNGYAVINRSIAAKDFESYFCGGDIAANNASSGNGSQYTDTLLPACIGGTYRNNNYDPIPHFLGFNLPGTGINSYQKNSCGRLIYIPQSSSSQGA